jgi:hypothetical protein
MAAGAAANRATRNVSPITAHNLAFAGSLGPLMMTRL